MPRISSDSTITHRIELGLTERKKLDEIIAAQIENQRLDAITNTLQAAGTAVAGGGAVIAALALAAWLAPSIVKDIKDKINSWTTTILNPITDVITEDIIQRRIQEYNAKMKASFEREEELRSRETQFCTPSSKDYDNQICSDITLEIEELLKDRQKLRQEATDIQTIIDEELSNLDKLMDIAGGGGGIFGLWDLSWDLFGNTE